ncbi:hypothetical protein ACEWY4_004390 [Coilia grayii]|uniref:Coiled-coil domain-containing protein 17 n=1 Tax=Coilia grayii TaxID=363190 RepID=A0ABD1KLX6_9TELE
MDVSTCPRCDMSFKSLLLLEKHKDKFCIGWARSSMQPETPKDVADRVNGQTRRLLEHRKRLETEAYNLRRSPPHKDFKPRSEPTESKTKPHIMDEHNSQIRDLAMHHDEQLADLSNITKQLEKQNREMDFKLRQMAAQRRTVSEMERTLLELRAQEDRNTHLLEAMMAQLLALQGDSRPHHTQAHELQRVESQSRHCNLQVDNPKPEEKVMQTFVPVYVGGLLSSEISNVRLSYLQNGGSSPQVLAQLQDLLNEALQVEMHHGKLPNPKTHQGIQCKREYVNDSDWNRINRQLIATEIQNQKLEDEIRKAQLRKNKASNFTQFTRMGAPRGQDIQAVKMDLDLLKHEIEINRLRRQIRTRKTPRSPSLLPTLGEARSQTPALTKYLYEQIDTLGPAPYDPVAGFVVFYDFLLGLSSSYRLCRLTVGLFSGDQALGSPSLLPLASCEPASLTASLPPEHRKGQLAMLATKQPVPGVHPAPALSLVLHLQASGGYDTHGQEVTRLVTRGWVKVDIFDRHNRVISGRWRVPLRLLPAKPSMTTGEMNTVPQLDCADLYLRVVNARDTDAQSSIPISHSMAALYRFPPVVSNTYCWALSLKCSRNNKNNNNL